MTASPLRATSPDREPAASHDPAVAVGRASAMAAMSAQAAVAAARASEESQALRTESGWGRVLRVSVARASLALVGSLVLWSLLPLLVGWTPRVILSGSMEPRVHVGDIVVTRPVPAATLAKGQVVTVVDPDHAGRTRTHRVLRRAADGMIVTKGDANPQADSTHVSVDDVLGLGVVRVPFVGRPAYWMAEGNWVAVGVAALLLGCCIAMAMPSSHRSEDSPGDDGDGDRPRTGSSRAPRRRRVAAIIGLAAVVAGGVAGPADAAFKVSATNPVSTLKAATNFWDYRTDVLGAAPYLYWRLDETTGTSIADSGPGGVTATRNGTVSTSQTGALTSESPNRAIAFTSASVAANSSVAGPSTFSVEAWVRTTSTTGGRILGFGTAVGTGSSTTVDRQLYLAPTGLVYFGIGAAKTTVASVVTVNDGAWHHVVGTYVAGTNGMKLYVDGTPQGQATATVQAFTGYWRAGREHLTGWAGNPSDDYYDGTLDELAVYNTVLTPQQITSHFTNATN